MCYPGSFRIFTNRENCLNHSFIRIPRKRCLEQRRIGGGGRACEGERERDLETTEMGGGSGREERGEGVGERRKPPQ